MKAARFAKTMTCFFRDPAADQCRQQSFLWLGKPLVIRSEVKEKLCCPAGVFGPRVTKIVTAVSGLITVEQPSGLSNNVLGKRCGASKQQCISLLQLVPGSFDGLHSSCDPSDLVLNVREDELGSGTNHRPQTCHCSLSFVDVRIQRDLRSHRIMLAFPVACSPLFESKSESKSSCCGCRDGSPSIPIDSTRSAEPPALTYAIKHRHSNSSLMEPILP